MKQKLDETLCKKYPKIFAQRGLPMNQTAMCWGFQCGDGWYTLIDSLCRLIQYHCDDSKCTQLEATTVKEKFGGLRFYVTGGDAVTEAYIRFAEFLSNDVCETCGTTAGVEQTEGWIYTMCKPCLKKFKNKQNFRTSLFGKLLKFFRKK
jgi:hypothetical protein